MLAVVEHEEEWFALIRVDGDDDPRVFVSDFEASQRGHYAAVLAPSRTSSSRSTWTCETPLRATTSTSDLGDDEDDDAGRPGRAARWTRTR